MKVLIIRFSSIGDIVLTSPVIRTLKTQLEDCELHYATKSQFKALLESNPYLDKLHLLEDDLDELAKRLKQEHFDCIIDLHHNLRTFILKRKLGAKKVYSFDKLNAAKWLMVNFKINRLPGVHLVDRYMKTVEQLGVKMDALGLDYFIPEKDEIPVDWLPEPFRDGYVVYAIGGQHQTKRLPVKRMIELCDKINRPVVLLGGKEDEQDGNVVEDFFKHSPDDELTADVLRRLEKKAMVYNACGKFNINQSASIVKKARYVFTHDSGLMHIAAAFRKEVFSIWGNTIPAFGMYPYRTKFTILENNRIGCRPCSKIGYDKCPKGHFKCMNGISFDFYIP
ncbi:MAG: glycosyltransferase family 9 protein [Bacteroidetes bacterium]|nr:glycosyltransferase family 9 protein [Bacteroidota bacterium]